MDSVRDLRRAHNSMSPDPVRHANTIIFPASLDPQAVSVVRKLREAGYESYLVGGCVRDLLLGHIPKDFDASTEARPRQIRRVFRNCRIIGRRFKLAHVHFGSHIIEVATFRKNPSSVGAPPDSNQHDADAEKDEPVQDSDHGDAAESPHSDDLLITRDNVYGTAEEDTLRRDFTINALLYDVLTDEVIDYVGGVDDIGNKILRTIGDPTVRIAEDPVRMLRAVKFTARLGLKMDPSLDAAMHASAEQIDRSAPPRVLEEIYKMMTCGAASRALELLLDYGLLERLLPELAEHWTKHPEECRRLGAALDHVDRAKRGVDNSFVLALLFHDVWRSVLSNSERLDPLIAARDLMAPAALRMNIPRRDVAAATQLMLNQSRLERSRRGRRFRMKEFLARDTTVVALDLLYVRSLAGLADPECHARWCMRLADHFGHETVPGHPNLTSTPSESAEPARKRPRRRSGRRRGGSRASQQERPHEQAEKSSPKRKGGAPQHRQRSRAPSAQQSQDRRSPPPPPSKPKEVEAKTPSASTPTRKTSSAGFAGRLKGFFKRVVGRSTGEGSETSSPPTGSTAQSHSNSRGSGQAQTSGQQTSSGNEEAAHGKQKDPGSSTASTGSQQGEGAAPSGRRRSRRRRRRGGRGRNNQTQGASETKSPTATETKNTPSSKASSENDTESKRRPERKNNSRGDSSNKSSGGSGRRRGRRGGRSSGSDRNKSSRANTADSKSQSSKSKSSDKEDSGRHPEDIEDTFDW